MRARRIGLTQTLPGLVLLLAHAANAGAASPEETTKLDCGGWHWSHPTSVWISHANRLGAWLERGGPPGVRNAELLLRNGDEVLHKHVVTWEVVSPITVSPKLIVMKPGKREYEAILRSGDRKPFRITRIECKEPGVEGKAANTEAADLHVVKINAEFAAHSVKAQGTITVFTNHPAQGKVDLPFLILD